MFREGDKWLMLLRTSPFFQYTGLTASEALFPGAVTAEHTTAPSPLSVSQGLHSDLQALRTEVTGPPVRQLMELA